MAEVNLPCGCRIDDALTSPIHRPEGYIDNVYHLPLKGPGSHVPRASKAKPDDDKK